MELKIDSIMVMENFSMTVDLLKASLVRENLSIPTIEILRKIKLKNNLLSKLP